MEAFIVGLIVVVAGLYLVRRFYKGFKQNAECTCDCNACPIESACSELSKEDPPKS